MDTSRPGYVLSEELRRIVSAFFAVLFPGGVTIRVGPIAYQQELHYSC